MDTDDITMQEEEDVKAGQAAFKKASSNQRNKMKLKHRILLILISLVLMGVLRTGFMFILIGLLPSVVAYYMDVSAERYSFKTIFACNLSAFLRASCSLKSLFS
jgi:1,4-dihydroxy-2-naphthoate octaprenyltransferase